MLRDSKPFIAGFVALTFMAAPLGAIAAENMPSPALRSDGSFTPLIRKVREATERFTDINAALSEHWAAATPCVSGPDAGAMGVHFVRTDVDHIHDGVLDTSNPEFLIYEPLPGGAMRLVGVEYIVIASEWAAHNPGKGTPALEGNLLNFVDAPNRYGLPPFYELHVWAWAENPKGSYADWNTRVTCDRQPIA